MSCFVYNNVPLPNQAADYLTQWIVEEGFGPGDKLPTEIALAKQLDVGRGTVREAIMILKSRNIVEVRRGCGTFVSQTLGQIDDPLGLDFEPDKAKVVMDWCKVRQMIEPEVAAMAAENATEEDLAKIHTCWLQMSADLDAGRSHLDSDKEFHKAIAAASGNIVMYKMVPIILEGVEKFMHLTKQAPFEHSRLVHNQLKLAIEQRNPQQARAITEQLLTVNREHLQICCQEQEKIPKENL